MKKLTLLLITLFTSTLLSAQIAYSPLVDSLKNEITEPSISTLLEQLSGEVPVSIGGNDTTLLSRHSYSPYNALAAQWIFEQFDAMGISVDYHYFNSNGENVVATITGSEFPDQQYIICAHYDDMPPGNLAPGADDNASGVVGVLEAARLLKDFELKYTVKFIAFDEEEQGLIGSYAYANEAYANGDDILGVINLDMIAWDSDDDFEMSIATNSQSAPLTNDFTSVIGTYNFDLTYNYISTTASDHSPFWNNGYQAILAIEDWNDFNDYYHTVNDLFDNCNIPYFNQMAQAAFATLASLSMDMKMELLHTPLESGNFTDDRIAKLVVNTNHDIGTGNNEPRLYYSVDGGSFIALQPYDNVLDTFYFLIPAQGFGSKVDYYLAAQDEASTLIATLPSGGKGVSPPGSVAPSNYFSYVIGDIYSFTLCSNTTPKPIQDLHHLYDTIHVPYDGVIVDVDVELDITHTYTGDVEIYLINPDGDQIDLCVGHGGSGNNFTGTIFDDEASTPIANGSAPFTGSYKPDEPLATFDDQSIHGNWVLHIYDNALNDQGTLQDWCLTFMYSGDPIYIENLEKRNITLHQNYPNPFTGATNISFYLPVAANLSIEIFDMLGRTIETVASKSYSAGTHNFVWDAGNLPQGRYFYRVQTDRHVEVKSMMLVK